MIEKPILSPETPQNIPVAFLFDVDGVITNPVEKKVTEPELFDELGQLLSNGIPVTLNTGRSLSWMLDRVIKPLEAKVQDKSQLANFLAVGEKGGSWISYENGDWQTQVDESISVPKSLQDRIRLLIEEEFADSMFYDESKLTMISTEMIDGYDNALFSHYQRALQTRMQEILSSPEYQNLDLKIDPTQIATDIQNSHTGKHLGARRIVQWLTTRGIKPLHMITVGDSQSDTEMAEELQNEFSTEFVFVNDPNKLDPSKLTNCKITQTEKRFGEGALEFLKSRNL